MTKKLIKNMSAKAAFQVLAKFTPVIIKIILLIVIMVNMACIITSQIGNEYTKGIFHLLIIMWLTYLFYQK